MAATHSARSASASHRWMACPGSVGLTERLAAQGFDMNRKSSYATEGTGAHEVGARCLRTGCDADRYVGQYVNTEDEPVLVTNEMCEAVQVYVDHVRSLMAGSLATTRFFIEQLFDLSLFYPGLFGTADCAAYVQSERMLHVIDYKHGVGVPVEVVGNTQLRYYGLGALVHLQSLGLEGPLPEQVTLTIVQPRSWHPDGPVRSEVVTSANLIMWAEDLVDAARATEPADAPLHAGTHCRFCPAMPRCPKLYEDNLAAAQLVFADVPTPTIAQLHAPTPAAMLSEEQLRRALLASMLLEPWLKELHAYAMELIQSGHPIPGWKLVQKLARRKWGADDFIVLPQLEKLGLARDELLESPKLRSPAQIEKLLPAKRRDELKPWIVKESSGVTLAPEADPRPAIGAPLPFEVITED